MTRVVAMSSSSDATLWSDLLSVIGWGLLAGVGLSLLFSIALRGLITASGARREGRAVAAMGWSAVGLLGVVACIGAAVLGIVTMLHR